MASDGSFVITWVSAQEGGFAPGSHLSDDGVYAQRYNALGQRLGGEFRVNTYTTLRQSAPAIAMRPNGEFVIVWHSENQDEPLGNGINVYGQRYNASGQPLNGEFLVNTSKQRSQYRPSIGMAPDGGFVVSWTGENGVYAQRYNTIGQPVGSEVLLNAFTSGILYLSTIGMSPDGSLVIAWDRANGDTKRGGIYAQRFDSTWHRAGEEFAVYTDASNSYRSFNPQLAMAYDGSFVVSWGSQNQDDSDPGTYARRFTALGQSVGTAFLVNTYSPGLPSSIAMAPNGNFVISWRSRRQDNYFLSDVYAQRFNVPSPSVLESVISKDSLTFQFSEPLAMSGAQSVANFGNWILSRNGIPVFSPISLITQTVDPTRRLAMVVVTFSSPLDPGDYEIVAKSTITALYGRELDGNNDGVGGDRYVERFTISPPPPTQGPPTAMVSPDAGSTSGAIC